MTAALTPTLDAEVASCIERIVTQARQQAADTVAEASQKAARRLARAEAYACSAAGARQPVQAAVLGRAIEGARRACDEQRAAVAGALAAMEEERMRALRALDARLREEAGAVMARILLPPEVPALRQPASVVEAVRAVGDTPPPPEGPAVAETGPAPGAGGGEPAPESVHFARLRALIYDRSLADPA